MTIRNLFDYTAELDAKEALELLRVELKRGIKYEPSFDYPASAAETLCNIAQAPSHHLGIELVRVLDHMESYSIKDILAMVEAFLVNIQATIDFQRDNFKREN